MHTRPVKLAALTAAAGMALMLGSGVADAAKKKHKKHHYRHGYSYRMTPAQYNQCRQDQFRYPERDIRCR